MAHDIKNRHGFTLIELVLVVVMIAVLGTIAVRSIAPVAENTKLEETRQEMETLAYAIAGNPDMFTNGVRTDFGYIGDIGALPPDLDALVGNPGYAIWNGPYISSTLLQASDDFRKDAWQMEYRYSGLIIASTGSGDTLERRLAGSSAQLLANTVSGNVLDIDGTPPGGAYDDSIIVGLIHPDGSGGYVNRIAAVDNGGYFQFDSVPIGNHTLNIIYSPSSDTLRRFVSVPPNSQVYGNYYLGSNLWPTGQAGGLEFIPGSDTLTSGNCFALVFWVSNSTSVTVSISSLKLIWPAPAAYYQNVVWNGTAVRSGNPALGSDDMAVFTSARNVSAGGTVRIQIESFHRNSNGGGPPVDMTGAIFTVEFSNGSIITFTADLCQG